MAADPTLRTQAGGGPLVGRGAEVRSLVELLEAAAEGSGTTVLVGGEAGVGKSRLCRELKREATARQMRVIEGRCTSTRASVAYGPFMDAIRFRIACGEREAAAGTLAPILAYLIPLFPELGSTVAQPGAAPVSQERAFEVISSVFQRLAGLGPLLLVLEDLHWADPTSLDLLQYLTRRIDRAPILVLGTYRSDELPTGHGMRRLLVSLTHERLGHRVKLSPLGRPEVGEMAQHILGRELAPSALEALWRRCEGNPFFLEELLGTAGETPADLTSSGIARELPLTIRDAVHTRIERLSHGAAEAVAVAAVIGRRFSYELLRTVSGLPSEELFTYLAELLDQQLLLEEHGPDEERYCFRHALTQEVLYSDILAPKRRQWHARIADALEQQAAPGQPAYHEEIAHHCCLGGDYARARGFEVLAGDGAARLYAWSAAEAHYHRALSMVEKGTPDPRLHASILEKLAEVLYWQSRPESALHYAEQAVAVSRRTGPPARTAALLRQLALLASRHSADRGEPLGYLKEALRLLEEEPESVELARVVNDMGRLLAEQAPVRAEPWLTRGMSLAQRIGEDPEIAFALAELGRLAVMRGHVSDGVDRLRQARGLLRETEFPLERATAIYRAGLQVMTLVGEQAAAREWLDAASAYALGHGVTSELALYQSYRASLARDTGLSDELLKSAGAAVAELRQRGPGLAEALDILGELHFLRGNLEAALACFTEALTLGERHAELGRARALLALGRAEDACGALEGTFAGLGREHQLLILRGLPILVEAHAQAGRLDAAAEGLARLEAGACAADDPISKVAARQTAGPVLAARGDRDAAEQALHDAVDGWRSLDRNLERAGAVLQLGELLLTTGWQPARGIALVGSALRELDEMGAHWDAKCARAVLQRQGLRPPARPVPTGVKPSHGLTHREREVLQQLAKGSTNKEIARALGISERTAGVHVSHLLRKLRCTTRTQAVSYAISHGLVQLMLLVTMMGGMLRGR
ncbi:MAG TPA: AAA family ATPase [Gemmatimonadales bacterium]|nr:AAA family ATPase [Gemmatimonadales bacterium]